MNESRLVNFALHSNNLSGKIPPSICNLRSLKILYLSNNSLEGVIPDCLGNLSTSIVLLHLNANKLSGLIPSTFTKGCSLQSFNLNGNRLEGTLPQTLVNCHGLWGIDIGDNEIRGTFPFWMETFPQLRILVLRSNKFNGTMLEAANSNTEQPFPKLQILDVSHNAFVGTLPDRYFKNFKGMIDANEKHTDEENVFLRYIVLTLTLKGMDQLLKRLLDTFTSVDLSSNKFSGSIPPSVGDLMSLRYLNLSHNILTGHIPLSLGNMSVLESLDLSSNKLDGKIPNVLVRLTFLSKLNLSMNNLEGKIPLYSQFSTFENASYMGNIGLCGFPLTKKCDEKSTIPQLDGGDDESGFLDEFIDGFGWRSVVVGYAYGFVIGIGSGYMIIRYGKPRWLVEFLFGVGYNRRDEMEEEQPQQEGDSGRIFWFT